MIELRRRYNKVADTPSYSRLPKGYQEVEYLESTGTQRLCIPSFDTNADFNIEMQISITEYNSSWTPILVAPKDKNIWIGFNKDNMVLRSFSGSDIITTPKLNINKFVSVKISRENNIISLYINDSLVDSSTYTFAVTSAIFVYFSDLPVNSGIYFNSKFKSRELKYDNYHFIPCYRISDRVAGMYDIVNDVFYTNAGTGEFLVGPDVHYNIPPEYQQVEYLESTGTQYMIVNFDSQYHSSGIYNAIGEHMTFGTYNDYGAQSLQLYDYGNDSASIRIGSAVSDTISPSPKYIQMDAGTGKIIYDDNVIQIDDALRSDFHFLQGIPLFGRFSTQDINPKPSVFKRFYVSYKNSVVTDLIPCYRKSDNVAGMYDIIEGKFHTNAGTGEFIVGPDVIG